MSNHWAIPRCRNSLAILLAVSLLASDLVAVRHVGSCCSSPASGAAGRRDDSAKGCGSAAKVTAALPRSQADSTGRGCCRHTGCLSRQTGVLVTAGQHDEGTQPASAQQHGSGEDSHDSGACPLCHWFMTARASESSCSTVMPLLQLIECQQTLPRAEPAIQPLFLTAISRRGPPPFVSSV